MFLPPVEVPVDRDLSILEGVVVHGDRIDDGLPVLMRGVEVSDPDAAVGERVHAVSLARGHRGLPVLRVLVLARLPCGVCLEPDPQRVGHRLLVEGGVLAPRLA